MMQQHKLTQKIFRCVALLLALPVNAWADFNQLRHADQRINIEYASALNKQARQQTHKWLQQISSALLTVYGEWPTDEFEITIKRSSSRSSPVPWGEVNRGEPTNVLLVINPDFDSETLLNDWTAYHELSHLLIPYRGYGDLWFSEGLATYYQNIIQARKGVISESGLWNKIASGFERGHKQQQWSHITLNEVSENMYRYGNFMRVHWSGVHYWLTADLTLRQRSENKLSLDSLLKQLKACCEDQSMSARSLAEKLDQLANMNMFTPLFVEYRDSYAMPDYTALLSELGIVKSQHDNHVSLIDDAEYAKIRKSIYQGSKVN